MKSYNGLKQTGDSLIRAYGRLRQGAPWLFRHPVGYFLYLTGRCNLACPYCWQRDAEGRPSEGALRGALELSGEEWIRLIKNAPRLSFFGLSGGEPLLHRDFLAIVDALGGQRPFTVHTNGLLLTDKVIERLITRSCTNLSISIDGFADVHDVSRDSRGLFDKIIEAIDRFNFLKAKRGSSRPKLNIKTVLLDRMIDRLDEFYNFVQTELKADSLTISLLKTPVHAQFDFRVHDRLSDVLGIGPPQCHSYDDPEALSESLHCLWEKSLRNRTWVSFYPAITSSSQSKSFFQAQGRNVYRPCHLPWSAVTVLADGSIIPCLSYRLCDVQGLDYDLKNLRREDRYNGFLSWRRQANQPGQWSSACDMCCFAQVSTGAQK